MNSFIYYNITIMLKKTYLHEYIINIMIKFNKIKIILIFFYLKFL